MKLLTTVLVLAFSAQVQAADKKISSSKDWSAVEVEAHKVSEKAACVASTTEKGKDMTLEVYAEANEDGGFVKPVVQIVTTEIDPALGVVASIDGHKMSMTIALKETKEIEVEAIDPTTGEPVMQKVEQQVFIGKFKDKETMIRLLRAKNRVRATFYNAEGEVAKSTFSLRGSSKTIKSMMTACGV